MESRRRSPAGATGRNRVAISPPELASRTRRLQNQLVIAHDKFPSTQSNSAQHCVRYRPAQMFFDSVSQRTCAKSRMKAALHKERNDGMAECELEAFVAKKGQFTCNMQTCDLHLHIIVQAIEDQLFSYSRRSEERR